MDDSNRILMIKFALGALCAGATVLFVLWPLTYRISRGAFNAACWLALAGSRLGLFFVVYIIAKQEAHSDVLTYYYWTSDFMNGQPLYDVVPSCYAPPFHYILMAPLKLWDDARSIVLLGILFELIALPLWLAAGRRLFAERIVRQAMVIAIVSPLTLWGVGVSGQNQSWIALLLALSVWLLVAGRDVLSGVALGLSTALIKFLPLLYAPAMVLTSRRPILWILGLIATNVIIYGACAAAGFDVLFVVRELAGQNSSGNLPFMASLFGIDVHGERFKHISNLAGLAALGGLCLVLLLKAQRYRPNPQAVIFLITILQMAFMLVSKKSHNSYLVMMMVPLSLTLAAGGLRAGGLILLSLFSIVASIEQSYWYRAMQMKDFSVLYGENLPEGITVAGILIFAVMQVITLWFYTWSFMQAWKLLLAPHPSHPNHPDHPDHAPPGDLIAHSGRAPMPQAG